MALEHHAEAAVARLQVVDDAPIDADFAMIGLSNPAIRRSVVVLPQPDGPTKTTNSPSSMVQLRSFTATTVPKDFSDYDKLDPRHAYLRTMPKLKPRARCLRMMRPTIISGTVMPTDSAAWRP